MRKIKTSAKPATRKPTNEKPTNEKPTNEKPTNEKPEFGALINGGNANPEKPASPVLATAKPAEKPDTGANRVRRAISRDAATVAAYRTHFGAISNRDDAYLLHYAAISGADTVETGTAFTLAALREKQANPFYSGSAKSSDAGALNRARKAGAITANDDCTEFRFTETGASRARALLAKA